MKSSADSVGTSPAQQVSEGVYEPDDGPLTEAELEELKAIAQKDLPTGKVMRTQSLLG